MINNYNILRKFYPSIYEPRKIGPPRPLPYIPLPMPQFEPEPEDSCPDCDRIAELLFAAAELLNKKDSIISELKARQEGIGARESRASKKWDEANRKQRLLRKWCPCPAGFPCPICERIQTKDLPWQEFMEST